MNTTASIFNRLLTATIFLLLFGCKKDIENQTDPLLSTAKRSSATTLTPPDVYVAGSEGGQAKYWKNGVGVVLTGGNQANGIAVDGSDVHVSGWGTDPVTGNFVAKYWLNGVLTDLSDGTDNEIAFGIALSGSDVFISGRVGVWVPTAVYWQNGVQTVLGSGQAMGISADPNGDIYIPNADFGAPSYWKNGSVQTLIGPSNAVLYAVASNGTDVYAVGVNSSGPSETALFWKNGTLQSIMTPNNTRAMAVAVDWNGDAVFSGNTGSNVGNMQIGWWDQIGDLNVLSTGQFVATTTGIAVDLTTNDVYVCGSEFATVSTPPARAKYWMITSTGSVTPVTLGSGLTDATALAITVVP